MTIRIYPFKIEADRMAWLSLLEAQGIRADKAIDKTYGIYEGPSLVATASTYKNIIKCIAIADNFKGGQVFNELLSDVINSIYSEGFRNIFVYTKPSNKMAFEALGFKLIAQVDNHVAFMEKASKGIESYMEQLIAESPEVEGNISAIVMNANPFTLGHRRLIEEAHSNSDLLHVFLVSEDVSAFPKKIRKRLLEDGVSDLTKVVVHETGDYLISSATFPSYFLKDSDDLTKIQASLDAHIFAKYFAKALNISHRYVGEEPYSLETRLYNEAMASVFEELGGPELHVIKRLSVSDEIISATKVRKAIAEDRIEEIKDFVPKTTYDFIISEEAEEIREKLRKNLGQ